MMTNLFKNSELKGICFQFASIRFQRKRIQNELEAIDKRQRIRKSKLHNNMQANWEKQIT
jgi:hypothetical protein